MEDILDYFRSSKITHDLLFLDYEKAFVYCKIPENCPSSLPVFPDIKFLKKLNSQEMLDYFKYISENRIVLFEGLYQDRSVYQCDYCFADITENTTFKHCLDCVSDMCALCFWEVSEAKNNGAVDGLKRKEHLEKCRTHDLVDIDLGSSFYCDGCLSLIIYPRYSNRTKDKDFCINCVTDSLIQEYQLDLVNGLLLQQQVKFGSLFDWVPIYMDCDTNTIYYNINKDSEHYETFAISSIDDHGREGYFRIKESLTAEDLKKELEELYEIYRSEFCDQKNRGSFFDMPIKTFMQKRNMGTNYG